jgi:hypothetical protein
MILDLPGNIYLLLRESRFNNKETYKLNISTLLLLLAAIVQKLTASNVTNLPTIKTIFMYDETIPYDRYGFIFSYQVLCRF